jgi:hypothetical protein
VTIDHAASVLVDPLDEDIPSIAALRFDLRSPSTPVF